MERDFGRRRRRTDAIPYAPGLRRRPAKAILPAPGRRDLACPYQTEDCAMHRAGTDAIRVVELARALLCGGNERGSVRSDVGTAGQPGYVTRNPVQLGPGCSI